MQRLIGTLAVMCLIPAVLDTYRDRVELSQRNYRTQLWELGGDLDTTVQNVASHPVTRPASHGGDFRRFLRPEVAHASRKSAILAGSNDAATGQRSIDASSSFNAPSLEAVAQAYRRAEALNRKLELSVMPKHDPEGKSASPSSHGLRGDGEQAEANALDSAAATLDMVTKSMSSTDFKATPSHLASVADSLAKLSASIGQAQSVRMPDLRTTQALRSRRHPSFHAAITVNESMRAREKRIEEDLLVKLDKIGIQKWRSAQARKAAIKSEPSWLSWL